MRVMRKVEVTDNDATPVRGLSLPATRESHLGDSSPDALLSTTHALFARVVIRFPKFVFRFPRVGGDDRLGGYGQ